MASKRIDELTTRSVVNTDLLPPTPTGGPSGSATVAATVKAGLVQPNSASAGVGADITIKAADGVTSGAGGNIILQPGTQATTGGDGIVKIKTGVTQFRRASDDRLIAAIYADTPGIIVDGSWILGVCNTNLPTGTRANLGLSVGFYQNILGLQLGGSIQFTSDASAFLSVDSVLTRGSYSVLKLTNGSTGGASFAFPGMTTNVSTDQNDLYLPGTGFQRINCTSASNLTGISPTKRPDLFYTGAHVDGRMIKVFNVGTANLTLKHNSTSSAAANRMFSVSGSDIVLGANDYAECVYDSTDNGSGAAGWRIA